MNNSPACSFQPKAALNIKKRANRFISKFDQGNKKNVNIRKLENWAVIKLESICGVTEVMYCYTTRAELKNSE